MACQEIPVRDLKGLVFFYLIVENFPNKKNFSSFRPTGAVEGVQRRLHQMVHHAHSQLGNRYVPQWGCVDPRLRLCLDARALVVIIFRGSPEVGIVLLEGKG